MTQCTCPSCGARLTITTGDRLDRPQTNRPRQGDRPRRQPAPTSGAEARGYVMPFGRHEGKTLAQIDAEGNRDYLVWGSTQWDRAAGRAVAIYLATAAEPRPAPRGRVARAVAELAEQPAFEQADGDDDGDIPY